MRYMVSSVNYSLGESLHNSRMIYFTNVPSLHRVLGLSFQVDVMVLQAQGLQCSASGLGVRA